MGRRRERGRRAISEVFGPRPRPRAWAPCGPVPSPSAPSRLLLASWATPARGGARDWPLSMTHRSGDKGELWCRREQVFSLPSPLFHFPGATASFTPRETVAQHGE